MSPFSRKCILKKTVLIFIVNLVLVGPLMARNLNIVKAAYIEKISRFVIWKDIQNKNFNLCIIDDKKVYGYLHKFLSKKSMHKRSIVLVNIKDMPSINNCQILYIGDNPRLQTQEIFEYTKTRQIMTISQNKKYIKEGVMINFYQDGNNLRFMINHKSFTSVGLYIDSRILRYAVLVD